MIKLRVSVQEQAAAEQVASRRGKTLSGLLREHIERLAAQDRRKQTEADE